MLARDILADAAAAFIEARDPGPFTGHRIARLARPSGQEPVDEWRRLLAGTVRLRRMLADRSPGVLSWSQAVALLGRKSVLCKVQSGRWQRPCRGVVVTHSGPLSRRQILWVAVLRCGPGALLAGATAADVGGLRGFSDERIWVLVPHGRQVTSGPARVLVRSSASLRDDEQLREGDPPRTSMPRSVVDAASWAGSDQRAAGLVLAAVQQRLVRPSDLASIVERRPTLRRRALIMATIVDAAGGSHTVSERDVIRLCRRAGLPLPRQQSHRVDSDGRVRWLDAEWPEWGVGLEIDGAGHREIAGWWADLHRGNALLITGVRLLRFTSFVVRERPAIVAAQLREVLVAAGWQPTGQTRAS